MRFRVSAFALTGITPAAAKTLKKSVYGRPEADRQWFVSQEGLAKEQLPSSRIVEARCHVFNGIGSLFFRAFTALPPRPGGKIANLATGKTHFFKTTCLT